MRELEGDPAASTLFTKPREQAVASALDVEWQH